MSKFSIIPNGGGDARYSGCPTFTGTYMKPGMLEFREIAVPSPIEWAVGDYVEYTRTGYTYRLYTVPQVKKQARSTTYGGAFVYQSVQFFDDSKQLDICPFRDLVPDDNRVHFSTQPAIAVFDNVAGIAERLQECLVDMYGANSWAVRVATVNGDGISQDLADLMDEDRDFSVSGVSVLGALDKIYEVWPDVGWVFKIENVGTELSPVLRNTIVIGGAGLSSTASYEYGKGNGLKSITRTVANADELATRIFAYGSSRNMLPRWYNSQDIKDDDSVDIQNLMIPISYWGKTLYEGELKPDAAKAYIDAPSAVMNRLGLRPKTYYFDGTGELPEIYPTIREMTIDEVRAAKEYDTTKPNYPKTTIYTNPNQRVDTVLSAPSSFDSGLAGDTGKQSVDTQQDTVAVSATGTFEAGAKSMSYVLFYKSFTIPESGRLDMKALLSLTGSITFSGSLANASARIHMTVAPVGMNTTSSSAELIQDGNSFAFGDLTVALPTGTVTANNGVMVACSVEVVADAADTNRTYTISTAGNLNFSFSRYRAKTFTIGIRQIGFNIEEQANLGDGKTIAMRSGKCAGRAFTIKSCSYVEATDSWSLEVIRSQDDSLSQWFPNTDYPIVAGNEFVLLDIAMPDEYILVAENRLLDAARELLDDVSVERWQYTPEIDAKFMVENSRMLLPAQNMVLTDSDIVGNSPVSVLIDSVTINEGDAAIPTYKVTLRDRKKKTFTEAKGADNISSTPVTNSTQESINQLSSRSADSYFTVDENGNVTLREQYDNLWVPGWLAAGGVGTGGGGGGSTSYLNDLLDVTVPNPSDGQALVYRNGEWVNETIQSGGGTVTSITMNGTSYTPTSGVVNLGTVITSLSGYATEQWVSSALADYAQKVSGATNGHFAALDSNGNLTDSGHSHADYLTSIGTSGDYLTYTKNGTNNNITVPFATVASKTRFTPSYTGATEIEPLLDWFVPETFTENNATKYRLRLNPKYVGMYADGWVAAGGVGTGGGGGGGATWLSDLQDVGISSPQPGHILMYDPTQQEPWVNVAKTSIADLSNGSTYSTLTVNGTAVSFYTTSQVDSLLGGLSGYVTIDSLKSKGSATLPVYFDANGGAQTITGLSVTGDIVSTNGNGNFARTLTVGTDCYLSYKSATGGIRTTTYQGVSYIQIKKGTDEGATSNLVLSAYNGASGDSASVLFDSIALRGAVTVGTAAANKSTTLNGSLSVTGNSTFAGSLKIGTSAYLVYDTNAKALRVYGTDNGDNIGFYCDGWVAAGGVGTSSGNVVSLSDLSDVENGTPSNKDILVYNSTSHLWEFTAQAPNVTCTTTGTGNALASVSYSNGAFTFTKGSFLTSSDITGKADKVSGATSGNFAALDANGNLIDSGSKASDFLTQSSLSGYVTITGEEEISGTKTFSSGLLIIKTAGTGAPVLSLQRGSTSDSYPDWKIKNTGPLYFTYSESGTDTNIAYLSNAAFAPAPATVTSGVSSLVLGTSSYRWGGVFSSSGNFSTSVTTGTSLTVGTSLSVAGNSTFVGTVKIGSSAYLAYDAGAKALRVYGTDDGDTIGFYCDGWVAAGGVGQSSGTVTSLSDLSDVENGTPDNKDILVYNSTSRLWEFTAQSPNVTCTTTGTGNALASVSYSNGAFSFTKGTFLTSSDITGKADKVSGGTSGNFAALDAYGNLTDSGSKASDFLTQSSLAGYVTINSLKSKGSATLPIYFDSNGAAQTITGLSVSGNIATTGGKYTVTPSTNNAVTSNGIDFGTVAHMAANTNGGLGIYATGSINICPGNGAIGTTYGMVVGHNSLTYNGNNIWHTGNLTPMTIDTDQDISGTKTFTSGLLVVKTDTSGTPTILLQRGTTADAYDDWKIQSASGALNFIYSTSGTETGKITFTSTMLRPHADTVTDSVSNLTLGSADCRWGGIYSTFGGFSSNVSIGTSASVGTTLSVGTHLTVNGRANLSFTDAAGGISTVTDSGVSYIQVKPASGNAGNLTISGYNGNSGNNAIVLFDSIALRGAVTVGTANANKSTTLNGSLSVTGNSTFSGTVRIGPSAYLAYDSGAKALRVYGTDDGDTIGFYCDGWVAAGGVGTSSGNVVSLDDLSDVTLSTRHTGDLLYYDGSKWINKPQSEIVPTITVSPSGTGNGVTGLSYSNGVITYTKGTFLTSSDLDGYVNAISTGSGNYITGVSKSGKTLTFTYGTLPTTIALSNVTGADDLQAIEALTGTSGLLKKTAANTWTLDTTAYTTNTGTVTSVTITASTGISVTNSGTAITTSGTRTISLASGVCTTGTYKSVTVDTYGRVTSGSNPTTLSGYGITDAKIASGTITLGSNTITPMTVDTDQDVSGTKTFTSGSLIVKTGTSGTPTIALVRGTTSDSYTDWKISNDAGNLIFIKSVSGTDSNVAYLASTTFAPSSATVTSGVSSLTLGTSSAFWGEAYIKKMYVSSTAYISSDSATNIYLQNSSGSILVCDGTVVRRGTTLSTATLGSSTYPWGGLYSTTGSFSSTVSVSSTLTVRGDAYLAYKSANDTNAGFRLTTDTTNNLSYMQIKATDGNSGNLTVCGFNGNTGGTARFLFSTVAIGSSSVSGRLSLPKYDSTITIGPVTISYDSVNKALHISGTDSNQTIGLYCDGWVAAGGVQASS